MATFGEPATQQTEEVTININGQRFHLRGRQTLSEGWLQYYKPYIRAEEKALPPMDEGQRVPVERAILEDKFTQPPPRYNPISLLKKMEKEGIGTKATRAGIIQTLYDRKYIYDERIVVTDLGLEVTDVLRKYCPTVASPELTRKLEEKMNEIQQGKETRQNVLSDVIEILKPVTERLKEKEKMIGAQLSQALKKVRLEENSIGICPTCQSGKLVILRSKRTGKRFVGCTNYFEGKCKTSFPLPQIGSLKLGGKVCTGCGWPTVRIWLKRRRPWNMCFNLKCSLKEEKRKDVAT